MINLVYIEKEMLPSFINGEKNGISKLIHGEGIRKNIESTLCSEPIQIAKTKIILNHDFKDIKQILSRSGMMYDYCMKTYPENWLPLSNLALLSLSDNQELLLRLCNNKKFDFKKDIGGWMGIQNAMCNIIEGDFIGLKDTIHYLKNNVKNHDDAFEPEIYWMIYEGFIARDKTVIEEGFKELESETMRIKRIKSDKTEKYFSIETTALAHQAWKYGMQVEVESDFVPKEWLPYKPLSEYTIPYWFLRDFYKEQGVKWRYDPIYPELQEGL